MSSLLASSLDYETTLANVAQLVVPQFADWCAVDVVGEDGGAEAARGRPQGSRRRRSGRVRSRDFHAPTADEPEGTARVVRTGEPMLYRRISDELLESTARDPEQLEVLRELGMASAMVVPMKARGRTLGALMLVSSDPARLYDDDALTFAEHLGRRAATAVDNALLYQPFRAARAGGAGAGVRRRRRDARRRRRHRPDLERGRRGDHGASGGRRRRPPGRRGDSRVGGDRDARAGVRQAPERSRAETVPVEFAQGERWLSISGVAFPGGTVYAFRDLTEERRVERLKSEFVSTISHELRTPLAAIYGAALTLRRKEPALEAQREGLLDIVASESERLARIVNDILWVSRLESGTLQVAVESCDAAELASAVVAAADAHLPGEPDARRSRSSRTLPPVAADSDKLRQILANLIDNAVKYSPDGGAVRLAVAHDERVREIRRQRRRASASRPPSTPGSSRSSIASTPS